MTQTPSSIDLPSNQDNYSDHSQQNQQKIKICVIGTRGFPNVQGGIEKHCECLYPYLAQKGCDIIVLGRKPYIGAKEYNHHGVRVIPLPCPKHKFLETILHTFLGVLHTNKIGCDIIHFHGIGPCLLLPLAKLLGIKTVQTNHGPDYDRVKWNRFGKFVLQLGEYLGVKYADEVISISEPITKIISKKCNRKNINIIPNGVICKSPVETDEALQAFSLEKQKYILAVGRLVPEKGFHDLIDAFNFLQQNPAPQSLTSEYKLAIVGDADHEDSYSLGLKSKAQENKHIVMTGFLSGKPLEELFSHAALFVLPSYHEGLPIVLLESMSYGLSCLASDIPANRNIELDDNRFFQPGNIPDIADKINRFIQKPLSADQKNNQISLIQQHYDWGKIAEETFKVYRKAFRSCKKCRKP